MKNRVINLKANIVSASYYTFYISHFYFLPKRGNKKRVFAAKTAPQSVDPAFADPGDI